MFSYLRYFALIGLLLVAVGALLLSLYFRQIKQAELMEISTAQVQATLSSYAGTVWTRYGAELMANPAVPVSPVFLSETKRFFDSQPITKITLFSPDVTRLYYGSTNAYVTSDGTNRITLFDLDKVASGQPVFRLLKTAYLVGAPEVNSTNHHTLMQLIIPITHSAGSPPQALAEVYLDITGPWKQLENLQYVFIGIMTGTFALLVGVLMYTASRAESIITRQHEVNLELTAAAAQAEAQSRNKSQFLTSVSHELRTPLNAIIGFSDIIRNEARDKMERVHQDYLDDIYASGKHLASLINDILDFSKAEAGKLQVEWAETDATKIIRSALRMVMPRAETAQVTLVEDVPHQHLVVVTDAKKLKQVLLNLLSNAVKFTRAGGEVRCHAWSDVVTGALAIEVIDTGIGIAPKDLSRVMTPFGQVDSALSRKYEGTGLGLPLAKKFVESMGGSFTIESVLNEGTTITITIPKAPPHWGTDAMPAIIAEEDAHVASDDDSNPA